MSLNISSLKRISLLSASLILLVSTCSAQGPAAGPNPDMVTDRPDVTEASTVVPKASFQIENGATWTGDRGAETYDVPESLIRIGVAQRTEIRFVVPNYLGAISGQNPTGFGDTALGIKQQLGPLRGDIDLSVIVAVSLPTGSPAVSSHGYDPFIKFPWSKDISGGWSIGGMESLFWNTAGAGRNGDWQSTFYVEKEITKPWDAFVEYAGDFAQRGGPQEIAHFGSAYRITRNQMIDFHFGFGISNAAPDHFYGIGYSFRVDKLWGK